MIRFLDQADAWNQGLVSIKDDGTVIMKADDTSTLPLGVNRSRYADIHTHERPSDASP